MPVVPRRFRHRQHGRRRDRRPVHARHDRRARHGRARRTPRRGRRGADRFRRSLAGNVLASHGTVFHTKVAVLAGGQAVTSARLDLDGAGRSRGHWGHLGQHRRYARRDLRRDPNPGGTVSGMTCASCHNPHGNGNYRILNPIPEAEPETGDPFAAAPADANVTDAALPGPGETRNYTVIQAQGERHALASQVEALSLADSASSSDYFHSSRAVRPAGEQHDPEIGLCDIEGHAQRAERTTFKTRRSRRGAPSATAAIWRTTQVLDPAADGDSGDAIFTYRHGTSRSGLHDVPRRARLERRHGRHIRATLRIRTQRARRPRAGCSRSTTVEPARHATTRRAPSRPGHSSGPATPIRTSPRKASVVAGDLVQATRTQSDQAASG